MYFYGFGLKIMAENTPKMIAAEIPALVTSKIPVITPISPCLSASKSAPWTSELPKLVIGTVAPAPAKSIKGSYNPNPSSNAPITTRLVKVWAGVNFQISIIN